VLLAALVGAGLGAAGAALQGATRNRLAEPYLLGVSGGAAVGAVIASALHAPAAVVPIAGFGGALVAVALTLLVARASGGRGDARVVLMAGVVVGAFANSVIMVALANADASAVRGALWWMMGSAAEANWLQVRALGVFVAIGIGALIALGRAIDVLALGDDTAAGLGVDVTRVTLGVYVAGALLAESGLAYIGLGPRPPTASWGTMLRQAYDPPFFVICYQGLDVVGHAFTRFARPERFGDVTSIEVRRYGAVVDRYAAYLGDRVGEAAAALRPGEVLLVISGYGMEPVRLWQRALSGLTGERPVPSGTHAGAPDGFLLAVGDGIKAGALVSNGSVLDVTPTILYLMGLPVARDMEGRVLTEIVEEEFARAHPLSFIPSYESLAVTPSRPAGSEPPPLPDEVP